MEKQIFRWNLFFQSTEGQSFQAMFDGSYNDWYFSNDVKRQEAIQKAHKVYTGLWTQFTNTELLESLTKFRDSILPLLKKELIPTEEKLRETNKLFKKHMDLRETYFYSFISLHRYPYLREYGFTQKQRCLQSQIEIKHERILDYWGDLQLLKNAF